MNANVKYGIQSYLLHLSACLSSRLLESYYHHTPPFKVAKLPQGSLKRIFWYFFLFFRPIETLIDPFDSFERTYINTSCEFVRENLI